MHVSGHFKHFALQANAQTTARAPRKKPANPEEVAPVKSQFSEDEQEEDRRQRQGWQNKPLRARDEGDVAEEGEAFGEIPGPQSSSAAAPAMQAAAPLDLLLAGMMSEASPPGELVAPGDHHEAAEDRSLDDLLALMRAAPQKL